jgi:hypothetical protein
MTELTNSQSMSFILARVPEFRSQWGVFLLNDDSETPGFCNEITEFARFAVTTLKLDDTTAATTAKSIFQTVEYLLAFGDPSVQSTVTNCFLGSLLAHCSHGTLEIQQMLPYLGEQTCKEVESLVATGTK